MRIILLINTFLIINCSFSQTSFSCNPNPDSRHEVTTDKVPVRYVCHIIVNRRHTTDPSTASLISPTTLLTAGHSSGEWRRFFANKIQSIRVLLFEHFERGDSSIQLADLTFMRHQLKFGAHPDFRGNKSPEYDYGFIKLPTDTLYKLTGGCFLVGNYDSLKANIDSLFITGYSSDKQKERDGSLWQKGDKVQNIYESSNLLRYGIYTETGDSGAPIWTSFNGQHYIVGIHNRGPEDSKYVNCNGGLKINAEALQVIEQWKRE